MKSVCHAPAQFGNVKSRCLVKEASGLLRLELTGSPNPFVPKHGTECITGLPFSRKRQFGRIPACCEAVTIMKS